MSAPSAKGHTLDGMVTRELREVRGEIQRRLSVLASEIGTLGEVPVDARASSMRRLVAALDDCLRPHLGWEERTIHPVVDKYACEGPAVFSGSMRYEHEIIYRLLAELKDLAEGGIVPFARRADNLLGLVSAHFELEEHVLFPILDRYVNPAAFLAWARVGADASEDTR